MLPFNLPIAPDESLHGYFLRLGLANGEQNTKAFLRSFGVSPRISYAGEQLNEIADCLGVDADILSARNPALKHEDPLLSMRFQRSARSPVCPACLTVAPILKQAWDHDMVTVCLDHATRLIDECPGCGESLTRERESITHCHHCGFELTRAPMESASEAELAITALLCSCEHLSREGLPGNLGKGRAPSDISEFLLYLATYVQDGLIKGKPRKNPRPRTVEESRLQVSSVWRVLESWPSRLNEFVLGRIRTGVGRAVHQRLGAWLGVYLREFSTQDYQFIADALNSVLAEHFDGHLLKFRRANDISDGHEKKWYSAAEAASALNSTAALVLAAVEEGRIPGRIETIRAIRYVSIHRDVIDEIKKTRAAHMTQSDARKCLGISKLMLQRLVSLGALQELNKDDLPPLVTGAFRQTDIEQFEARLQSWVKPRAVAPEDLVSIQDISLKRGLLEAQVTSVLQDISHGVIRAVAVVPDSVGISALRFDLRDIKSRLHTHADEPMLQVSDLVRYGGWKRDDIKEWIKGEFLQVHRERQGQRTIERIPLSSLITFMTRYAVLSDASKALKTTTNDLLRTLKPAGIKPSVSDRTGLRPGRGLLVEKLELIRGAQLRRPIIKELVDQLDDPEVTHADDA